MKWMLSAWAGVLWGGTPWLRNKLAHFGSLEPRPHLGLRSALCTHLYLAEELVCVVDHPGAQGGGQEHHHPLQEYPLLLPMTDSFLFVCNCPHTISHFYSPCNFLPCDSHFVSSVTSDTSVTSVTSVTSPRKRAAVTPAHSARWPPCSPPGGARREEEENDVEEDAERTVVEDETLMVPERSW